MQDLHKVRVNTRGPTKAKKNVATWRGIFRVASVTTAFRRGCARIGNRSTSAFLVDQLLNRSRDFAHIRCQKHRDGCTKQRPLRRSRRPASILARAACQLRGADAFVERWLFHRQTLRHNESLSLDCQAEENTGFLRKKQQRFDPALLHHATFGIAIWSAELFLWCPTSPLFQIFVCFFAWCNARYDSRCALRDCHFRPFFCRFLAPLWHQPSHRDDDGLSIQKSHGIAYRKVRPKFVQREKKQRNELVAKRSGSICGIIPP